jgi:hypothetical protein
MTRRKKTDGERIVDGLFRALYGYGPYENKRLSIRVNRLIRRRMAEAWDLGRTYGINNGLALHWIASDDNPYRRRKKK